MDNIRRRYHPPTPGSFPRIETAMKDRRQLGGVLEFSPSHPRIYGNDYGTPATSGAILVVDRFFFSKAPLVWSLCQKSIQISHDGIWRLALREHRQSQCPSIQLSLFDLPSTRSLSLARHFQAIFELMTSEYPGRFTMSHFWYWLWG